MNPMWLLVVCAAALDAAQSLIANALGGDRSAMRRLADRLIPVIRSTVFYSLRRLGRDSIAGQDVDDLAQEVWIHLFADGAAVLRKFDPSRGNLEGYMTVVARSKTRGIRKTAESQRRGGDARMGDIDDMHSLAGGADPEAQAMSHQLAHRLKARLIDALPERGKLVFTYIYVDGKKPEEAAKLMKVKTQVIYNWQHKIRTLIRSVRDSMGPAAAAP